MTTFVLFCASPLAAATLEPREIKVGVAASNTVLQDPGWKEKFKRQLAYASKIFENSFHLSFRPVIFWDWNPKDESHGMNELIEDLKARYPLQHVDMVIGVASLFENPADAKDPHVIGRTQVMSGYMMLRHPRKPLLYIQEETVLTHELGHLFGAVHTNDPASIMSPVVERQIPTSFDSANQEIIMLTRGLNFRKGAEALDANTAKLLLNSYLQLMKGNQSFDFYYALGTFYLKAGDSSNALQAWQTAARTNDMNPRIHYDLGILYSKLGHKAEAVKELSEAVNQLNLPGQQPYRAGALNLLGAAYFEQGNQDAAYRAWTQAAVLRPNDPDIQINLAILQMQKRQFQNAIKVFKQALRLDPHNIKVLSNLGSAYYQLGQYGQAVHYLTQALETNPKQTVKGNVTNFDQAQPSQIYSNLGFAYLKSEGPTAAIPYFESSCRLNPAPDCYKRLGELHYQLGNWDEAANMLSTVLKYQKEDPAVYGILGTVFARNGEQQKAVSMFREGLKYATDAKQSSQFSANLGNLYLLAKAYDLAKREFQIAIARDWNNAEAHYGLANVYLAEKDLPKAEASLQRVLKIDPNHQKAKSKLAQINIR